MKRRTYLSAVGVGAAALAGCTGQAKQGDDSKDGIRLAGVHVENTDTDGHTVRVLVKFDGELVHWSAADVEGFDSFAGEPGAVDLEPTWPDERGEVTIHARLDDTSGWKTENLGDTIKGSCADVYLSVDKDAELTIRFAGDCETPTQTETTASS